MKTTKTGDDASAKKSATVSSRSVTGAAITTSTEPMTVQLTPRTSRMRNCSPKNTHAITSLATTATAPSGVTIAAPAKPNATKLSTSPPIVPMRPTHQSGHLV